MDRIAAPMNLLLKLYGDEPTADALGETAYLQKLVRVEQAVAQAQGELGVIPADIAGGLEEFLSHVVVDVERLWADTRNVGYPVLPLVTQIDEQLPEHLRGFLHWGLTTQDVMDTALVLQIRDAIERQCQLLTKWGDALATLTGDWQFSVAPARTHAQQAVPTTVGARFAVFLEQVSDASCQLLGAAHRASRVSLHGAGGTSAAMGPSARDVRRRVADLMGLADSSVPWHVARQSLVDVCGAQTSLAMVVARLAREVVDLSRNEIGELSEAGGPLRGASSTMPQKANPIDSEAMLGLGWMAVGNHVAMLRALEAGHERSAGEWQVEWAVLPAVVLASSSAIATAAALCEGLQVHADRALVNTAVDGGALLAEAYMMRLAPLVGREEAHALVYRAVRATGPTITLSAAVAAETQSLGIDLEPLAVDDYVGDAPWTCDQAVARWSETRRQLAEYSTGMFKNSNRISEKGGRP